MMENTQDHTPHPYAALTPEIILDAVEAGWPLRCDGRLLALNSYENRVYQVWEETGRPLIAKFYRPERWSDAAILEEHAFVRELAAHELPVVPPLPDRDGVTLRHFAGFRVALYPRMAGREPPLDDLTALEWLGRMLGRLHAVGAAGAFQVRPTLSIERFAREPAEFLLDFMPSDLKPAWQALCDDLLRRIACCFDRCGSWTPLRLHGDCHPGNILWTSADGPGFVDFDDALRGPAVQDLWMLLSGDRADMRAQLDALLDGYSLFCDFDVRELYLVEGLRTMRMLHYAAWIARRWQDPAFPRNFPWFGTQRYFEELILSLKEQAALMDEPPLLSGP